MSVLSRIAAVTIAGVAALGLGTPAQAIPSVYLFNLPTSAECTSAGTNGVSGAVFVTYSCQSGIAGYSLSADPTYGTFTDAYIATFPTLAKCKAAGDAGIAAGAWTSYKCRPGIAGWDLLVTK
ncbi:hypothetical protein [Actinokineospora sp. NBRC 105648]|uniref:hypothetical protein n=1 Tax=Actinokineospora sp. NBRC 105648 TaxID=3032206 RepID=UPI0024A0B210|nr:hypothetical protein [Actinokineospora sp. NBRC 105648]GLZ41093.1 hypothetical protein Acsp05_47170 [Actinokineospora sp. NBRC 105648]